MKRIDKLNNDRQIFEALAKVLNEAHKFKNPSYELLVNYLNDKNLKTSWGNAWTRKSLFRYLQRNGFSGVWGLRNSLEQYTQLAKFI
ncbi:hypothetical protein [Pseudoalteromonas sp. S2893]|uniref:hypothetical protein n=1 Tax=Pseudoalteromonas sp. S2893 TaxID=579530 RepID=UPI00110A27E1|nr:hypothetical protein [Pseudoalteromonas sp. S2893]TMP14447.1 hypothetical protein CWC04_16645 [Pseudoalteromonas sp. S2893]